MDLTDKEGAWEGTRAEGSANQGVRRGQPSGPGGRELTWSPLGGGKGGRKTLEQM